MEDRPGSVRYLQLLADVATQAHLDLDDLVAGLAALHRAKNAGYSGIGDDTWANFRQSLLFGVEPWRGALVRMSDKYIRVGNLLENADLEQVGESVRDTLQDLAAYAMIVVCLLEEEEPRGQTQAG